MAHTTRLDGSWELTDSIMEPFPFETVKDVASLLVERGILNQTGFTRECEWIFARNWEYRCAFEASEESDERAYLRVEHVYGAGKVIVNGQTAGSFGANGARMEITSALREGNNTVCIRFDASRRAAGDSDFFAPMGLAGDVRIEYGSYLDILTHSFTATDGVFLCEMDVNAHVGGKYIFHYTVIPEDGDEFHTTFTEHLRACASHLRHSFKIENCVYYDRNKGVDSSYIVRMSAERGGIGCAFLTEDVSNFEAGTRAATVVRTDSVNRRVFFDMGFEGIDTRCAFDASREGFLPVAGEYSEVAFEALSTPQTLLSDPAFALSGGEAWRYSGSKPYPFGEMERLFGKNASSNVWRAAKLTRLLQAEKLQRAILTLRAENKGILLPEPIDTCERPYSCALIESDGMKRPAYSAVKMAIMGTQCLTDAPLFVKKDTLARMRVGLVGKKLTGMYSIKGDLYTQKGDVLASLTFPAYATDVVHAGMIYVRVPPSPGCGVLRVTASKEDGTICGRADFTLCWGDEETPMESLLSLESASLAVRDGKLCNTGSVTAFSVATGLYYGALLPGESAPIQESCEVFNG